MANYDVAPDGPSFVMVEGPSSDGGPVALPLLHVVLDWSEELSARVPNATAVASSSAAGAVRCRHDPVAHQALPGWVASERD